MKIKNVRDGKKRNSKKYILTIALIGVGTFYIWVIWAIWTMNSIRNSIIDLEANLAHIQEVTTEVEELAEYLEEYNDKKEFTYEEKQKILEILKK